MDDTQSASNISSQSNKQTKKKPNSAPDYLALPSEQNQPTRVLIVDDNDDILELLAVYLSQEGYMVQTANSGQQALILLDEFQPDVMVSDFMMPEMDGQELARQIRARQDMLYLPIVMLTAVKGTEAVKLESLKSGVDAFLTKPVKREELKITIRTMLRMKAAQDNMLAALNRVAEVQEELLNLEHHKGQYEAMQATVDTCVYELSAPLNAANLAATKLGYLLDEAEISKIALNQLVGEARTYLKELRNALAEAKESLVKLDEAKEKTVRHLGESQL